MAAIFVDAENAQGEIESSDASVQLQAINVNALNSSGTASAQNATVQIAAALNASSQVAGGTASAQNATAAIAPVVAIASAAMVQADSLIAHALVGNTIAAITKVSVATVSQLFTSVSKGPAKRPSAQSASVSLEALAATVIKSIETIAIVSVGIAMVNPANVYKPYSLIVQNVRANSIDEDVVALQVGIDEDVVVQSISEDIEV